MKRTTSALFAAVILTAAAPAVWAQPEIDDMLPIEAHEGCTVSIIGSGFSSVESENDVSFNGVPASVADAAGTCA